MKKTRKILAMAACAVLLVCISVGATVAYLTATESVTNTFTVGKVAITLDEAKVTEYGVEIPKAGRVQANSYKLLPGHTYVKDPTIHVDDESEPCYLFVKVENGIADIEGKKTIEVSMKAQNWVALDDKYPGIWFRAADDGTEKIVAFNGGDDAIVFDAFTISEDVLGGEKPTTNPVAGAKYIGDYANKQIKITAYAIQADGFANSTPEQIWQAIGE